MPTKRGGCMGSAGTPDHKTMSHLGQDPDLHFLSSSSFHLSSVKAIPLPDQIRPDSHPVENGIRSVPR